MKILLLGANGQLGWELRRALLPLGDVIALTRNVGTNPHGLTGDVSDFVGIEKTLHAVKPTIIVNAAAYTAVDKAQTEQDLAYSINSKAPELLAKVAEKLDAWLVHYSTDYVFTGQGSTPWKESDEPCPLNVYGASKLAGETAITSSCTKHLILRTSWVYGLHGNNFVKTVLTLATEQREISVINDQIGVPTSAALLADVTALMLYRAKRDSSVAGIYHCTAQGEVSWFDYAHYVIKTAHALGYQLKLGVGQITPIASDAYPTPAKRPKNSRLDCSKLERTFELQLPKWDLKMDMFVESLYASQRLCCTNLV